MRHEEFMKDKFREEKIEMSTLPSEMAQNIISTADRIGSKIDMVNSPPHYNQTGIECIHAISAATNTGFKYYLQGNILKYLWRFDYKDKPLEDLEKAKWYLDKLIEEVMADGKS
tara:strand:+ start:605 stop:946 length:342 start_codon:yes stop_codon:yes gene_type:complete